MSGQTNYFRAVRQRYCRFDDHQNGVRLLLVRQLGLHRDDSGHFVASGYPFTCGCARH